MKRERRIRDYILATFSHADECVKGSFTGWTSEEDYGPYFDEEVAVKILEAFKADPSTTERERQLSYYDIHGERFHFYSESSDEVETIEAERIEGELVFKLFPESLWERQLEPIGGQMADDFIRAYALLGRRWHQAVEDRDTNILYAVTDASAIVERILTFHLGIDMEMITARCEELGI